MFDKNVWVKDKTLMTEKKDSKEDFESILKVGNEVTIYGVQVQ